MNVLELRVQEIDPQTNDSVFRTMIIPVFPSNIVFMQSIRGVKSGKWVGHAILMGGISVNLDEIQFGKMRDALVSMNLAPIA